MRQHMFVHSNSIPYGSKAMRETEKKRVKTESKRKVGAVFI
jgi:hypothetical protein